MNTISLSKMEVSKSCASSFCNMAVWESGYNVCVDVCRMADSLDKDNNVVQQLRSTASQIPLHLSTSASFRLGRQYIRHLRTAFVSSKQLETILMLCHDLNYIPTEKFLETNSKLNVFSSKLWKYIKYSERKLKQRQK
jgi:four helix bundle protein